MPWNLPFDEKAQTLWLLAFLSTRLPPVSRPTVLRVHRLRGPTGTIVAFRLHLGGTWGKFACVHRNPQGLSHEEEIFISDLISLNLFARDQGGYAKENRP